MSTKNTSNHKKKRIITDMKIKNIFYKSIETYIKVRILREEKL